MITLQVGSVITFSWNIPVLEEEQDATHVYIGDLDPARIWQCLAEVGLGPDITYPQIFGWDRHFTDDEITKIRKAIQIVQASK